MRKVVTNCFLIKENKICLAMKKRGLGVGLWNGTGGKIQEGETVVEAARREAKEELGVDLGQLESRGEVLFVFEDDFEVFVYLFLCYQWQGEPSESEEMAPEWFDIEKIPYEMMWQTDKHWLPVVLRGTSIKAVFHFNADKKTVKNFDLKEI
ncbi:MAG: 8-oxo-dGTP diphosphatase [Candidatus Shapirobacteria bacterium]|jgi:8-oxo-dGTP pyrophosphatase MutT (NUDIX family)